MMRRISQRNERFLFVVACVVFILWFLFVLETHSSDTTGHPVTRFGYPSQGLTLRRHGFIVGYDGATRCPKWTLHRIRAVDLSGDTVDRKDEFRSDPKVPAEFRIALKDYIGSGLDRGHLVPSADLVSSRVDNSDTFFLSNMAPQLPKFNRGVWKSAESMVRKLATRDDVREVYVMSGPAFRADGERLELDTFADGIPIPTHFWKSVLVIGKGGRIRAWGVMIPHDESLDPSGDLTEYAVTIDQIESIAGLDLWPALADDIESKMESKLERWR